MEFITRSNRQQTYFAIVEDQVSADNPVSSTKNNTGIKNIYSSMARR